MLCFKFHKNHSINEEFDFFEGEEEGDPRDRDPREGDPRGMGALIHKFSSQLLLVNI